MGRLGSEMETGDTELPVSGMALAEESRELVDFLEAASGELEDLRFVGIHSVSHRPRELDAALQGTFWLRGERFQLKPPIDWWGEPYRRPNERGFLQNSFVFAEPLLAHPRFPEALVPLAAIFTDWLTANPQSDTIHPHRYAWHDHAAAGRIVAMAFVLREGIRRSLLEKSAAERLAGGVVEHARYLIADKNYAAHHNHGFASDAALMLATRSLAPAPQATAWSEVAERRFAAILDYIIDREEAIHLEHSPGYHWIIRGALSRFAAAGLFEGLDLTGLARRMEAAGAWIVAPDGTLPPLGDTPMGQRSSAKALAPSGSTAGLRVFPRAGYAVVRDHGSALIVTAAHHPTAHKHADDGSFCLYEDGRPIVLDSGSPGYQYESAEFRYGTSPAAHATICVDDFDWAKESPPYGSGVVGWIEQNGIFALLTCNPGAVPGGGAARRALVYEPGGFLLAVDDVEASSEHQVVRSVPLAAGLDAAIGVRNGVEISRDGSRVARLTQVEIDDTPADKVELAFGQRDPEMRGFSFPTAEEPQPSWDVSLVGSAGRPRAYAILLDDSDSPASMTWNPAGATVDIAISGLTDSTLTIRLGEDSISLETVD